MPIAILKKLTVLKRVSLDGRGVVVLFGAENNSLLSKYDSRVSKVINPNCAKKGFIGRGVGVRRTILLLFRVILIPGLIAFLIRC